MVEMLIGSVVVTIILGILGITFAPEFIDAVLTIREDRQPVELLPDSYFVVPLRSECGQWDAEVYKHGSRIPVITVDEAPTAERACRRAVQRFHAKREREEEERECQEKALIMWSDQKD